ncbi:MAG: biliverdin-producing heme oxygenase [Ramlibacter sp.]
MAPSAAQDILEALREGTAQRHASLEAMLALRQPFGRGHYVRVLQGFDAFLSTWEPRMARALPERLQAWFAQGRRLHLLQQDLTALGAAPVAIDGPAVPALDTLPAALGSLYVLEGSALGGQFIAAAARRHLGLAAGHGAAYFHGCGSGTAARWREFRALVDTELADDAPGRRQAVRAAADTFDGLAATFRGLVDADERAAA